MSANSTLDRCQCAAPGDHGVHDGLGHEAPEHAGKRGAVAFRFQLTLQRGARAPHDHRNKEGHHREQDCFLDVAAEPAERGIEHDRHDLLGCRLGRDLAPVADALDRVGRMPERRQPADRARHGR
jgi:hypothetical protein